MENNATNDTNKDKSHNGPPAKKRKLNKDSNSEVIKPKTVKFYKMDLENNDIGTDVYSVQVRNTSNTILSIPLDVKHKLFGGILVCSANMISYIKPQSNLQCQQLHCFIPKRVMEQYEDPKQQQQQQQKEENIFEPRPQDIVTDVYDIYYDQNIFYILLQTDRGDIIKVDLFPSDKHHVFISFSMEVLDAMPITRTLSIFPDSQHIFFGCSSTNNFLCKSKSLKAGEPIMCNSFRNVVCFSPKYKKISNIFRKLWIFQLINHHLIVIQILYILGLCYLIII